MGAPTVFSSNCLAFVVFRFYSCLRLAGPLQQGVSSHTEGEEGKEAERWLEEADDEEIEQIAGTIFIRHLLSYPHTSTTNK